MSTAPWRSRPIEELRADSKEGLDHILMARVTERGAGKGSAPLYQGLAADLAGNHQQSNAQATAACGIGSAARPMSRIIVCVNMLGEGFDLPALKIAAVHDPQKSLGVTLQFIGRFARTSSAGRFGEAAMFVARREIEVDRRLRTLYAEDSDWNLILRNLSEAAAEDQQQVSDFEEGFTSCPRRSRCAACCRR